MNFAAADEVVKAVLYEGYVLYPYRPTSIKNQQRWTFGGVYPAGCPSSGNSFMQTQCLVEGDSATRIEVRLRFLQPLARQIGEVVPPLRAWPGDIEPAFRAVASLQCEGRGYTTWEEAIERDVRLPGVALQALASGPASLRFEFAAQRSVEPIVAADGRVCGVIVRAQAAIQGSVTVCADAVAAGAWRLEIRVDNTTVLPEPRAAGTSAATSAATNNGTSVARDAGALHAFMSTHLIVGVNGGAFVSLIDPPPAFAKAALTCSNQSAWPVLVGDEGSRDTLLCSPIILYDHPQIAADSPGDLFDGTEIDEILTLRILAMTDAEKREMVANDERTRALLARTEALTEDQLQRLHGVMRNPRPAAAALGAASATHGPAATDPGPACTAHAPAPAAAACNPAGNRIFINGAPMLRVGAQVRLHPKRGGDIFDIALAGHTGVIEAIEVDFDNRVHVAVTVDADPGQDLGRDRMPGHRFFFSPDEIECLQAAETR